jgi:hypothetical protein
VIYLFISFILYFLTNELNISKDSLQYQARPSRIPYGPCKS